MMKTLKHILKITCLSALMAFVSCEKEIPQTDQMEVNFININGNWSLDEVDGMPLAEGTYYYISFNRKEHTFTEYSNLNSMYAFKQTGTCKITNDDHKGDIITGRYDSGKSWNEYLVVLSKEEMTWTRSQDLTAVQHFKRVQEIPQSILDEARHPSEEE